MNEQQQYEKHLAEKFQQLPLPDVEPNWQQMKLRLDKEMPRGGGYWRWMTAFGVLLFMLGSTWFFINRSDIDGVAGIKESKEAKKAADQGTPSNAPTTTASEKEVRKNVTEKGSDNEITDLKTNNIEENLHATTDNKKAKLSNTIKEKSENLTEEDLKQIQQNNILPPLAGKTRTGVDQAPGSISTGNKISADEKSVDNGGRTNTRTSIDHNNHSNEEIPVKQSAIRYQPENFISQYEVAKLTGDSIKSTYPELFPENVSKNAQVSTKLTGKSKSAKPSPIESVENRTLAIGLSLPMGFPLGDQKPGAYNMNAKPNTVSDFLPVPHMQYHINNKVYLQTELQFMNPQYIQPVLLYQTRTEYPSTNTVHSNSVYARKLYYLNVPVGIHYSPLPHFYLGTGLQFSSLVSGVALQEETNSIIGSATSDVVSQRYTKFRNDTLSNRIDNSEFRLMLDANYYWKQFTVGLRYNQALSNYVSLRLNSVSPLFQDKNKSLQFYLRYNLWEDYKRRKK